MPPAVSIIIPVYNAERTVGRCIESILNQEYTDFELLLVNDGSTDDTGALCDSFQTTRFGYSSSTVITVMPKNCFSAWLNAPETAENRPPLFP